MEHGKGCYNEAKQGEARHGKARWNQAGQGQRVACYLEARQSEAVLGQGPTVPRQGTAQRG
eukprot:13267547-Alexandrium_andersonii.AAC.1